MLEKELIIQQRFNQLRQTFHDIIYQKFHIQPPKDLLNRYIMIKLNDIQCDIKDILSKDLAMSIPIRLQQNYDRYDQYKLQQIYQKNFNKINQNIRYLVRNSSNDEKQLIKQFQADISQLSPYIVGNNNAINQQSNQTQNNQDQKYQHEKSSLVLKANKLTKLTVEFNMKFYQSKFSQVINELENKFQQLCTFDQKKEQQVQLSDIKLLDQQQKEISDITQLKPQEKYFASYKNETIEISAENVFKLYDRIQSDFQEFKQHLFIMLFRYQSYQGNTWKEERSQYVNKTEGINLQARVYQKLMNKLNEKFDVKTEMFASPVNCTFEKYFSQFEDVDKYFQSQGSCFNLKNNNEQLDDIIECNPPFTEEMLVEAANTMIQLLKQNRTKIVIYVCPSWREDCAKYHLILDNCEYKFANIQLEPNSYRYSCGGVGNDQGSFSGTFSSEYYILCNDSNKEKAKQIENFLRNFKHQYH